MDTLAAGDPVNNGTWTAPDSTSPPTIVPLDPAVFIAAGTGTAASSGTSVVLVFKTSGPGIYGVGTCGTRAFWTGPAAEVFGPNNPNCLDYESNGSVGNEGLGQCVESPTGEPGLFVTAAAETTQPFHPECLLVDTATTTLALSFTSQAQLFAANDGTGSRLMNFYSSGLAVAQLVYDGLAGTTTGAGILVGSDNASPANTWTIYFAQPALNYVSGLPNGDLIGAMSGSGVRVVACSTQIACSLVTLQLTP